MHSSLTQIQLDAAIELIKQMGTVIRYLDNNIAYPEYWIKDDSENNTGHVPKAVELGLMQ